MIDKAMAERLEHALQRRLAQPPEERRADLIHRGVIDKKGRVLHQAPTGPSSSLSQTSAITKVPSKGNKPGAATAAKPGAKKDLKKK